MKIITLSLELIMDEQIFVNKNNYCQLKIHKWIILYFFIVISLPPLRNNQIIYWSSIVLTMIAILYVFAFNRVRINKYIIWIILINMFVLSSILWSLNEDYTINGVISLVVTSIPYIYLTILIKNKNNVYDTLKLFVFSKVIMAIYILFNLDGASFGNLRIGADVLGDEWNANTIGMNVAISALIAIFLIKNSKIKLVRFYYVLLIILFTLIALLTGSKKALFILFFSISLYIILSSKKYKISKSLIILFLGSLGFYLIFNVPFLYEVLGSRIDSFLADFTGTGVTDRSTVLRMSMIEQGINFFQQQPIFGYGINNFRHLFGQVTGSYEYAHNNYIELLVGIGMIGTLIYYTGHLYILKKTFMKSDNWLAFVFVIILTVLVIDIGLISYNSFYIQFLICISFSIIDLSNRTFKHTAKGSAECSKNLKINLKEWN